MKQITSFLIIGALFIFLASCDPENVLPTSSSGTTTSGGDSDTPQSEASSDYDWSSADAKTITFNGTSVSASSTSVSISGATATITAAGNYIVSGTLTNGQLIVKAPSAVVKIQMNGVTVTNSSTSPFYIQKAAKVIVFLPVGTTNTFTDATSYTNTGEPNACICSNSYLAFTGEGTLNVNGKYADGISSDDQTVIKSGIFNVTAVDDGIRGKDYLLIHGGTITATCNTGHALKSNNTATDSGYVKIDGGVMTLASNSGKGIKAVNKYIQDGGIITITKSYEGVESFNVIINGGSLDITASNDGINGTAGTVQGGAENNDGSNVTITGGTLLSSATNGDAIDCNGNVTVTGGLIIANGPSSGIEEAVDINGTFNMNGGVFVGAGATNNMNKSMSATSTQPNMYIKAGSAVSSSSFINVRIGTIDVITFKPKYGATLFLLSAPAMTKGASYTIYTGGSYSASTNTGGYYSNGTYTPGTSKTTGTISSSNTVNSITF